MQPSVVSLGDSSFVRYLHKIKKCATIVYMRRGKEQEPYAKRSSERWDVKLAVGLFVLSLPSSAQQVSFDSRLPYDVPHTSPSASAAAFPLETPVPTPASTSTPELTPERVCQSGEPVTFSWPDMGIHDAPIEKVGDTVNAAGERAPEEPHGRDASGAYSTVGWYSLGPKPGAEQGTPIFLLHSTRHERSLLYPRDEKMAELDRIRRLGGETVFWVLQDNGSRCEYAVSAEDMALRVKIAGDYPKMFAAKQSLQPGVTHERPLIVTCNGEFDAAVGTSADAAILQATPKN